MDALTKFAPAYFDYTRKAFQGHVSFFVQDPSVCRANRAAPECISQDLRVLQDRLQECCNWSINANERFDHGESILRSKVF
jgi:hypothetical protein